MYKKSSSTLKSKSFLGKVSPADTSSLVNPLSWGGRPLRRGLLFQESFTTLSLIPSSTTPAFSISSYPVVSLNDA